MYRRSVIALAALLATASPLCAQTRVFDLTTVSQVAEVPLMLKERADGHIIELRNIDPQNAAALDIVGASGEAFQSLQAQARPNGIVLPSTAAGSFTLIVRAQASDTLYVADVWLDGALLKSKIRFSGGTALTIPRLGVGEEIVGVARPNGPTEHVAYLMSADGANVLARDKGPVTHLRRREAGDTVVMFGALSEKTGAIRVYRNDFANDTDGDGLGDALENVLGICASRRASAPGINCALTADTRDTDGDGLWDSWEVMGVNGQALPAWGADPRHKDIFVEVDFRRLTLADNQSGLALRMTPAVARQMASIYADSATTDAATRATHAQDVGNPDGQPGVSLHLDIGVPPETPADATTYGDWGGYTAVDAVPDGQGGYMPQPRGRDGKQYGYSPAWSLSLRARLHDRRRLLRHRHRLRIQYEQRRKLGTRVRSHTFSGSQWPVGNT